MARTLIGAMALVVSAMLLWLGGCRTIPTHADDQCEEQQSQCLNSCGIGQWQSNNPSEIESPSDQWTYSQHEQCLNSCSRQYEKCSKKDQTP